MSMSEPHPGPLADLVAVLHPLHIALDDPVLATGAATVVITETNLG